MIGLVLVTHGRLAQEFISAMEHMVGPQTHLRAICIGPEDDIERRQREIAAAAKSVDVGRGVIIATDMFGGTPCNLALTLLDRGKIEVLAGVRINSPFYLWTTPAWLMWYLWASRPLINLHEREVDAITL